MTDESIRRYVDSLRYRQYTTGVMHVAAPQWLEDIRELIKCVNFLLEQKEVAGVSPAPEPKA